MTWRTGGSSPCTPCSRLHEGTRSNQPFHLSVSLWFAPPASSLLTLSRFPQQSPLFFSPPICQCGDVIKDIIRKICNYVQPPTSPTNTVSTLSRLGAFFFSFLSFLFLLPRSLPLWVRLSLTLKTETACFPPTLCLWYLGREKKARGSTERERRRRINSCFCSEAATLHQEHFFGSTGSNQPLLPFSPCPFRAEHMHSR